jgi:alanine racemase
MHGMLPIAQKLGFRHCYLAVAYVEEAVELRDAGY